MLPSDRSDSVGTRNQLISELNTLPTDAPLQRFKRGLTTALTWLGARVARYAFPVRLFHSRLPAGLSRRYPDLRSAPGCVACSKAPSVPVRFRFEHSKFRPLGNHSLDLRLRCFELVIPQQNPLPGRYQHAKKIRDTPELAVRAHSIYAVGPRLRSLPFSQS